MARAAVTFSIWLIVSVSLTSRLKPDSATPIPPPAETISVSVANPFWS